MTVRPTAEAGWIKALGRAALPGAAAVTFTRQEGVEGGTPTICYTLSSYDADGQTIGDDRDYDLLKAVMTPLERLAEASGQGELVMTLDLNTKMLSRA